MKLLRADATDFEDVKTEPLAAAIVGSGYEARARFVAEQLEGVQIERRVALAFINHTEEEERKKNDTRLTELGYELVPADGDHGHEAADVVRKVCQGWQGECLNLLVDYSSMTRVWYSTILRAAASIERPVRLFMLYSPAKFHPPPPQEPPINEWMGPLDGFSHLHLPDRRIALVIGLGYEMGKALALSEYVDTMPETYAMYTRPGSHEDFVKEVQQNNSDLMARLGTDRVIPYPFDDLGVAGILLNTLVSSLVQDRRVILAPLGPKPFCLLSLILSLRDRRVDVWRVSGGKHAPVVPRKPTGEVLAFEVAFPGTASP